MTLGELVVQMRLNSAAFNAEMENVGKKTKAAANEFGKAQNLVTNFAKQGLAAVIPAAIGAEVALGQLLATTLKAGPPLVAVFGKIAVVIGAAIAAYKAGEAIRNFVLGEDAARRAEDTANVIERRMVGIEAAHRRAARSAAVEEEKSLIARRKARDEYDEGLLKQIRDEHAAQAKAWTDETQVLIDELRKRRDARAAFEANLGQGGLPGSSAAGGMAAVRQYREQLEKELKDLAFLKRDGGMSETDVQQEITAIRQRALANLAAIQSSFGHIPIVAKAAQAEIDRINFTNLGAEMAKAKVWLDQHIATTEALRQRTEDLARRFESMPQSMDRNAEAVRKLTDEYTHLAWAIYGARQQLDQFGNEAAA